MSTKYRKENKIEHTKAKKWLIIWLTSPRLRKTTITNNGKGITYKLLVAKKCMAGKIQKKQVPHFQCGLLQKVKKIRKAKKQKKVSINLDSKTA